MQHLTIKGIIFTNEDISQEPYVEHQYSVLTQDENRAILNYKWSGVNALDELESICYQINQFSITNIMAECGVVDDKYPRNNCSLEMFMDNNEEEEFVNVCEIDCYDVIFKEENVK